MKEKELERQLHRSKEIYDSVEIPQELDDVVKRAVVTTSGKTCRIKCGKRYYRGMSVAAAAVLFCFVAGLNTSPSFASAVEQMPVLGSVSKLLTFRTYDKADEDKSIHMEIPKIQEESRAETASDLAAIVNEEIERTLGQYEADASKRIEEYKAAFLATGGTEEEFRQKDIKVDAGYQVYYESEDMLSFVILANENWSGAYGITQYYNLSLKEGRYMTLEDFLGADYVEKANESIRIQMKTRMEQDANLIYWGEDMDGFTTVDDKTNFYINDKGNPVIVFDKYEVAPGAFGRQEFEISKQPAS